MAVDKHARFTALRQQAAQVLADGGTSLDAGSLNTTDLARLMEELCIYHEELKIQNDELAITHTRADSARAHYQTLFNLLPLTPLDGGQIVDTFLFARRPRFRFAFFTVSVLALIGIALMLDSTALAAAGVLLALGIPSLWRRLRMLSGIDLATESDVPTAIFKHAMPVSAICKKDAASDSGRRPPPLAIRKLGVF